MTGPVDASSSSRRYLTAPVAVLPRVISGQMQPMVERTADDLCDDDLAALVHKRLRIEHAQGWAVFGAFATAFSGVFLLSGHVRSDLLLAVYASCMATMATGVNAAVERVSWRLFLKSCHRQGLSEKAAKDIYERASFAGQWLAVLRSCGSEPSNADLAAFVFQGESS